ncbi:hypothetical protein [Methanoculleus chikugoensis]|uniref:hypothetical protein n=1 Tax=Methanoculleus chikugoensis TaxID=118126 RepID=UPI001FB216FC|nr:hypothetical protein [Methanoculleus chikugoensis]
MRESLRRPLLFLITVGTGSVIIVFDAATEIIIAGTVLAGFLALVVTGALDLAELKPSRLRTALRERGKKKEQPDAPPETVKPGAPAESPSSTSNRPFSGIDLSSIRGMFGTFKASIMEAIAHARAPEDEKKSNIQKIDAMLDQAVEGAVPDQSITPAPPKAGGNSADPLASLADLDIDSLEGGLDLDDEASAGTVFDADQISLLSAEDAEAISDILKSHQDELDEFDLPTGIDLAGGCRRTRRRPPAGSNGRPGTARRRRYAGHERTERRTLRARRAGSRRAGSWRDRGRGRRRGDRRRRTYPGRRDHRRDSGGAERRLRHGFLCVRRRGRG